MASLSRSFAKVGSFTLLSRVLGFVRDLVVARLFGADGGTDAFFVALKAPNFMRRLFAEGAISVSCVPVLLEYRKASGHAEVQRLIDHMAGTLGALLLLVTLLGVVAAPMIVLLFAPGFAVQPEQHTLAAEMLRLTFPYLFFIALTALAGAVLNAYERFGVPAFTPVLLNLCIISCALLLAPALERPVMALAWGVLLGGLAQLAFQIPPLLHLGLLPRPRFDLGHRGVQQVLRLMGPSLFAVSVTQIGLLLDTLLASFLAAGSISWLYYSDRLVEFPLGILGVALGTVMLPRLSRKHLERSPERYSRTIDWALRWVLVLGLPAAAGLVVLAGPILATLFHSGAFTAGDVRMASLSLMAYASGLLAFMAIKVLAPGYLARLDTRTPVRMALVSLVLNLILSLALMAPLGHAGLALATGIAALVNAALLLRGLVRDQVYRPAVGWRSLLLRGIGASLILGGFLWWGRGGIEPWLAGGLEQRVLRLAGLILLGGLVYGATFLALGGRPRHLREGALEPGDRA